ncbi:alpha/beta hydrolase family protein [Fodinibius halophilus]|uniref:S9 family peptidase n=1 Tax=Fodinibius halophilus TaxID=1736908 RepID=A0A6M1T414_9BACT|nr:S9 family peptidase [Fodinibius halophilus]NGP88829.1 S9 family peptidase [Fodinibius halophilus]
MISTRTNYSLLILVSIVLLWPAAIRAQSSTDVLTPEDVANIEQVSDIAIAPSGDKAAYTLRVQADPHKENKPASYHLYLADLASGNSLPYVTTMSVSNIAFRPNHGTITFLGHRSSDETTSLYEISMNGGEAQKIFSFKTAIADYSWASDGDHLAFMAADTNAFAESSLPYEPEVYEENLKQRRGFVTNLAKEGHKPHQLQVEGSVYQMHWSPEGKRLAIAVAPTPLVDDYYMHQQVKITAHHGKEIITEVDHEGKLGDISWSPDGSKLAMIAAADIHDPTAGRLFVISAESGETTQLQPQLKQKFEQFAWAGNDTIYYLTSKGVWSTYGRINTDGTEMTTIVDSDGPSIGSFDRTSDGSTIVTASTATHPSELFQLNDGDLKRITNSNPWLENKKFGEQKVVSWKAEDGTELQGILVYPLDFEEGKRYPMITSVHGGPEAHYDNGWVTGYSDPGQVGAAQGYFVFYPNYRGSTGRGEAFAKSSQADMAGAEFDDIVAGVDELIEVGLIDSAKVGVTGGSYGGYATGWMSTRYTDRFAAGVMFVGISNNISKWGTSDIPEELFLVHARERIWDDYQSFLERSPIYHAGQANTPLLIMAGKQDTRVDPGQSYELYRHIKTRTDTPVRLVLYPGEGHGNAKATARFDYNIRMMRWFNEYLKGDEQQRPAVKVKAEK